MQFKGVWRDYQARVLDEMDGHLGDKRLHVVAAPGAGKTVLGLEIMRRIDRPTLVFAPTVAVRDQWAQRLCPLFLDEPPLADEISRDLSDPRQMTLVTYQALDAYRRAGSLDRLIEALNGFGPMTLMLDEAHHLRREWWRCLETLSDRLRDVRIVALTATPPYDASFVEWTRYEGLCGPIDLEIGIPELVRNRDLCPHQDHVILSEPTEDMLALLDRRRAAITDLQNDLRTDIPLVEYLEQHPWLTCPDDHVEAILESPEMLSAVLVLLGSAGRTPPRAPLDLLGVSARDLPPPSLFWLERFLDGVTGKLAATFDIGAERLESLRDTLHRQGLIEGGKVRLYQTHSIFRRMASSLAKLESIVAIARAEQASLDGGLRMVVLSDHVRAGELPAHAAAEFRPAKLGVVPIFETLRRAGIAADHLAVLTGGLVLIPRAALADIAAAAADAGIDPGAIKTADLAHCRSHVRIDLATGGTAGLVRLVTRLFSRGDVRILVGTQSLLGEGWDAPALNSLILASNTASFMLSNQMRGRAIRIDPANPDKVSNIWHLATVEAETAVVLAQAGDVLEWGHLGDEGLTGLSDAGLLQRRFRAFECISNGNSRLIESGIARLAIDTTQGFTQANRQSFALAADRPGIARRWAESLGEGSERSCVRQTAAPNYAPRRLAWYDTLHALGWGALGSGGFAVANALRQAGSIQIGTIGMGLAGIGILASLPKLVKAARLVWRNGSLEGSLGQVGETVLHALAEAGIASEEDVYFGSFEMRTSIDGRKDVILTGVTRSTERQVMQAIAEILGPVGNPRYLLVRNSWLGWRKRSDYHAVPTILGTTKETAERFAALWSARVGSSTLLYTRTPKGRRALLRARARSFAAGFQRTVDRRSAWL